MLLNWQRNKVRYLAAILAVGIVTAILLFRLDKPQREGKVGYFREGDHLPASLRLQQLDGREVTLGDFKGKVILINFWAGWCGPCLHEMPSIASLYQKLAPRGFVVLAPAMDDEPSVGVNTLKRVLPQIPFPIFAGQKSELAERFPLSALPHTVVLDKELVVQFSQAGEVNWSHSAAVQLIERLL